jgi:hypothetical protein
MNPVHVPESLLPFSSLKPAADAAGRNGTAVSLKNAKRAFIVCHVDQGNAAQVTFTPQQCTAVAGTGAKALTNDVPIWAALDVATSELPARQTAAKNFQTDAAVKEKIVIFQVDPSLLDVAGGFDCIRVNTGASNVANITQAMIYLEMKHGGAPAQMPRVATD